jgi:CheY-like chemotaxis protein
MHGISPEDNHQILVIDDNPSIHEDIKQILGSPGSSALENLSASLFGEPAASPVRFSYTIDSAYQGQEGLEKVIAAVQHQRPYALGFVDMRMPPGWDGIETIEHLWQADPELQIVICTAYSDYSWSEISTRLGATDQLLILKKPFDMAEVRQLAAALTRKWTLSTQHKEVERLKDELVLRCGRKVRSNAFARMVAGRDGRPDSRFRAHPRGHDGGGWNLFVVPDQRRHDG